MFHISKFIWKLSILDKTI